MNDCASLAPLPRLERRAPLGMSVDDGVERRAAHDRIRRWLATWMQAAVPEVRHGSTESAKLRGSMVERQPVPSTGASDDETRALLQARLGLVFTVLAGVSFFYTFSQTILGVFLPSSRGVPQIVVFVTLATGVCNALLAFRCRGRPRSLAELRALDAGGTVLTCWFVAVGMSQVKPGGEASVSLQLGLTYILLARAVLLPSSGPRTLVISVLALVPDGIAATAFRVGALDSVPLAGDWVREGYLVFRGLVVTAFLATLTSHVIYGLRRQVRESTRISSSWWSTRGRSSRAA